MNLRAKSDGNAASSFTFTGVSCAICLSCSHRLYKGHLLNRNVLAALGVSEECASRNARSTSVGALLLRAVVLLSLPSTGSGRSWCCRQVGTIGRSFGYTRGACGSRSPSRSESTGCKTALDRNLLGLPSQDVSWSRSRSAVVLLSLPRRSLMVAARRFPPKATMAREGPLAPALAWWYSPVGGFDLRDHASGKLRAHHARG